MTKKDYVHAANHLIKTRHALDEASFSIVVQMFIDMFSDDNPRFNTDTFVKYINYNRL